MPKELPPLPTVPLGEYEHYKGNHYRLLGLARHSETLEPMVIYQALYGDQGTWVRPAAMFQESVDYEGQRRPRFRLISEE